MWSCPALETTGLWKPTLHLERPLRPDRCHPEWRWVWHGMRFLAPLVEGGGSARDWASGLLPAQIGTPTWGLSLPGLAAQFNGASFWRYDGLTIPPARPLTVLVVLAPAAATGADRAATANASTASFSAWTVWTHDIDGTLSLRLTDWSGATPELTLGAMTADTWYAAAMTTDRTGGTPRGAMLNLSTRALVTATGTQQTLPTQSANPLIANAPDSAGAGGGAYQFIGALALVAWLPGVAWSERQLIQWVHDPFAFLLPARRLWAPSVVVETTVSQAAVPPWEGLATPRTTAISSWEALATPRTTAADPWEATARASTSTSAVWEAIGRTDRVGTIPWEAAGILVVSQSAAVTWEATTRVVAAQGPPWEAVTLAVRALSGPWEALGSPVRTGAIPWEAEAGTLPVTQSAAVAWEALAALVHSREAPWEAAGQEALRLRTLMWYGL